MEILGKSFNIVTIVMSILLLVFGIIWIICLFVYLNKHNLKIKNKNKLKLKNSKDIKKNQTQKLTKEKVSSTEIKKKILS